MALSEQSSATPRRSVSFGPTSSAPPASGSLLASMTPASTNTTSPSTTAASASAGGGGGGGGSPGALPPSSQSTPSAALKPALKPGTERRKLPPPEQYQHPDPLLRRLRLAHSDGSPVNLREYFQGVKLVGFYFSSQWAGQPLKEYHKTISAFCQEHKRDFRIIYVSVDVDERWYKAGVKGQPWVSMVWNDGSSLPTERADASASPPDATSEPPALLYNSEDFLLAMEEDIDESLSKSDTSGTAYLRPFSRVHLAAKLGIIAAPTLCVYHIESKRMLDRNVRMARLEDGKEDETWARWIRGEGSKAIGFSDAFQRSPFVVILFFAALLYWAVILIGGPEYNILGKMANDFAESRIGASKVEPPVAAMSAAAFGADHDAF